MKRLQNLSYKTLFIILFFSLAGIVFFLKIGGKTTKVSAAWWDDMWHYRKAISIGNSSGSNLTDFQVSISIGTSQLIADGKMQTDCDDIRITDINGNLLPYWIETTGINKCNQIADTRVWVKTNSIPISGSTVYIYYGNPSATSQSSGKNTFIYFKDNFQTTDVGWNWSNGSVENGWAKTWATGADNPGSTMTWIKNIINITGQEVIVEFTTKATKSGGTGHFTTNVLFNPTQTTSLYNNNNSSTIANGSGNSIITAGDYSGWYGKVGLDAGTGQASNITNDTTYPIYQFNADGWVRHVHKLTNSSLLLSGYSLGGLSVGTSAWTYNTKTITSGYTKPNNIILAIGEQYYENVWLSEAFVHKYAASEPTVSNQSEESGGGPIAYWKFDNNEFGENYTPLSHVTISNDATNGYLNSINTGITFNNATKLEFTLKTTDTVGSMVLVSGYSSSTTRDYPCILGSGGNMAPSSFTTSTLTPSNVTRTQISDGNVRTFTLDFTSSSNYPISFGSWIDGSWSRTIDWYSFKIWNGNTLIRNLVPVKRNSDSVVGFYDTVNKTFYTNAGTGSFTAGNTLTYDSAGNNNGTFSTGSSSPTWADESQCISGKCLSFDGTNDYLETGTTKPVSSNFPRTVSVWVKSNDYSGRKEILNWFGTFLNTQGNKVCFYINGANTAYLCSNNNLATNQWNHIVVTYENSSELIYINGKLDKSAASSVASSYSGDGATIGICRYCGYTSPFLGLIDDIKIYPYARTATQIKTDYNSRGSIKGSSANLGIKSNTAPPIKSSLVAYYKFDENNGTTVSDSSGNKLNGTLGSGNSAPTWITGKINRALYFDGINDFLQVNNIGSTGNIPISISLWTNFKSNTSGDDVFVIYGRDGTTSQCAGLYLRSSNSYVQFTGWAGGSIDYSTGFLKDYNIWHHWVLVYNGSTVLIYRDGVPDPIGSQPRILNFTLNKLLIGGGAINGNFTDTQVDEVKIYNKALTADEVKQDYNAGSAIQFGTTNQTIGGTTTSLDYCIPGDTSYCAAPVAEWNFEENTGTTTKDISGNNNNGAFGTGNSTPTWAIGKKNTGTGLKFDGNDYINNGVTQGYTGNLNINFWVKTNSSTTGSIVSKYGNNSYWTYRIYTDTNGKINFERSNNTAAWTNTLTSIKSINDNNWHFISANYDSTKMYIYIDGQLDNSVAETRAADGTNYYNFCIGNDHHYCTPAGPKGFFNGSLDNIKIYNYARTPAQIAYDYNKGAPIGWWKFDECQGSTANDSSGLGNTGSISIGLSGSQTSLGTCQTGTSAAWTNGSSGHTNGSLNFDGTDDYVNLGTSSPAFLSTPTKSVTAWIKVTGGAGTWRTILAPYTGSFIHFQIQSNNKIETRFYGPSITVASNTSFDSSNYNKWFHISSVWDGTYIKLYVNGILENTSSASSGSVQSPTDSVYIGNGYQLSRPFNGQIDDVRIYNYALTSEQVKTVYNNGAINFN